MGPTSWEVTGYEDGVASHNQTQTAGDCLPGARLDFTPHTDELIAATPEPSSSRSRLFRSHPG